MTEEFFVVFGQSHGYAAQVSLKFIIYTAKATLEILIHLPSPPSYGDFRYTAPHLGLMQVQGLEPRTSNMQGKPPTETPPQLHDFFRETFAQHLRGPGCVPLKVGQNQKPFVTLDFCD